MNKFLSILFLMLVLIGCASNDLSSLSGNWIDKESEFINYTIISTNGDIWLEASDGKFKINQSNNNNFVTINKIKYPVEFQQEGNKLLIGEKVFIPESTSFKKLFLGNWENKEKNISFKVTNVNGGIYWDITKGKNKPIRYYPKLTKEGFTFTYGEEQLFFVLKKDFIKDSKGIKYYREVKS